MSALVHINDEFGVARITCADDEATIWVRSRDTTVSLDLNAANLDALEKAIADARLRLAA